MTTLMLYTYKAVCVNVVDGDTVDLNIDKGFRDYSERRIRLSGIDTPERGQEGYREATEFLEAQLLGNACYIQSYKSETFGRWLGEIFIETSEGIISVNQLMIDAGFAEPY